MCAILKNIKVGCYYQNAMHLICRLPLINGEINQARSPSSFFSEFSKLIKNPVDRKFRHHYNNCEDDLI